MDKFLQNKKKRCFLHKKALFALCCLLLISGEVAANKEYNVDALIITQVIKEKLVTLNLKNKPINAILFEIQKQSGVDFAFSEKVAPSKMGNFTINVKNVSVEKALIELFKNSDYQYKIVNNRVIIDRKVAPVQNPKSKTINFTGRIYEKGGKTAIPGATITIEGTTRGAISDMGGTFTLKVQVGDQLEISCVGKKTERITIYEGMTNFTVELKEDALAVEDVYVTGYGKIKTHEMVGAATKITGDDLDKTANRNIEQMLQGKVAGLVVTNNSGMVGTRQKVKVRGTSTLLGNQEPVWVVDGMIQEDPLPFSATELNTFGSVQDNFDMIRNFIGNAISWLNPNDIETITVLKDASATAIYGVKAANGVIVITTKRGKEGKVSVSYSGNFSINQKTNYDKLNLMNSKERVDVSREIIQNGYTGDIYLTDIGFEGAYKKYMNREISYDEFNRLAKRAETINTDWLDLLMRSAMSNSHSISLSGGSDRISYYSSLSANFNKGEDRKNQTSTYGANLNISMWIIPEKLSVTTRLSGSMNNTGGVMISAYDYAIKTNRSIEAYNEDGSRFFYPYDGKAGDFRYNFEHERDNSSNKNNQNQLNGAISVNWKIRKGIDLDTSLGYGLSSSKGSSYLTERSYAMTSKRQYEFGTMTPEDVKYQKSVLPHGGQYNYTQTNNFNYTARVQLSFNHTFKGEHRINASLGYEMRSSKYDGYTETTYGYLPDRGHTFSLPPQMILVEGKDNSYDRNGIYDDITHNITDRISNYISGYMTAGYSYKERYIISGNVRSDASNRFGQNSNAKFLPVFSVGVRWNIAEEAWMMNQDVVNNLSLRGSYGWQGNVAENFGPDLIASIVGKPEFLTKEYIMKIKSLAYPDLKWEKVKTYNFGADFGLFKNKLQVSFNYYYKHTEDMIAYLNVPMSFGTDRMPINGGSMSNSGWDLTLTTTPIRTKNFMWNLSLNTAKNNNKIDSKLELKRDWKTAVDGTLTKDGYAFSSIWAFKYLGLDPTNGTPIHYIPEEGDPNVNPLDATTFMEYVGCLEPDFTGGLSTSFKYKNLSLSASFNLNIGAVRFMTNYLSSYTNLPKGHENMSREFNDRWRKPGDENRPNVKPSLPKHENIKHITIVEAVSAYSYEMYNNSDVRVVNANFLRCNSLSLSYTLSEKLLKGTGIKNVSLNVGMSNPFKIVSSDFKGVDPEVATGGSPLLKSYNFGISITL